LSVIADVLEVESITSRKTLYLDTNVNKTRIQEDGAMKRILLGVVICLFAFSFVATVYAGNATEAKALVEKGAAFMKANGKEKTLSEISKLKGQFDKGDLYIFAYDMTATVLAHPKNPKIIGKNLLEVPDNDGKYFRKDVIQGAKTKGSGWVDYKYLNPDTKKVEPKTTYFLKVEDIILCAGAYK
jgi:cytochrome c